MDSRLTRINKFGSYLFGTCLDLDHAARNHLFRLFENPPEMAEGILSGRLEPVMTDISGVGAVVVKHYRRGGIIRHFVKSRYVGIGRPRSRREYEMLETVRALGGSSPEPLLWAIQGRFFFKAFLVTRRIEGHRSLSDLGISEPASCRIAVGKVAEQIRLLIENRIFHVDLHPGNVLVNGAGQVYLIDFDKARRVTWHRDRLSARYVKRWERAVEKYSLPAFMTDWLVEGLKNPPQADAWSP